MKSTPSLLGTAVFAACLCHAADPYVGYVYPAGVQAGTTVRLVVGGQALQGVGSVWVSGTGVHVQKVELVPGFPPPAGRQRVHLTHWLDGIARGDRAEPPLPKEPRLDEWRSNRWWTVLGTLDDQKLAIVARDLYTPRNALQASPSLRQMMLVTVSVDADAQPGVRSLVAVGGQGLSAPRPLLVTAAAHTAEPLYAPPHRPRKEPAQADVREGGAVLDGQVMPGETDVFRLRLAAGRPYAFTVTARELQPYIGDAVPGFFNAVLVLKDADGKVVATADDASRFRPDPELRYTPPAEGTYTLEIHDVLYRGRADFVYSVLVDDAGRPPVPDADGVVAAAGQVCAKSFTVDAPGPRVLEVTARRKGSPLDAVLTLRKEGGGPALAQWDDMTNAVFTGTVPQGECDPVGLYDFREPGRYVAEITDRTGHGGPDYAWWLDIRTPNPGFAVYSTRSTLPLKRGRAISMGFRIVRKDGFSGDVAIEFPNYIAAEGAVATAGVDRVAAKLRLFDDVLPRDLPRAPGGLCPIELFARAEINGCTVRVPVVPCDEYEQAFAWKHLVPAETFLLRAQLGGGGRRNRTNRTNRPNRPHRPNRPSRPDRKPKPVQ